MKKIKNNKGITLVALIITIVVLVILAAVTVNSIKNDGILSYAGNAAGTYNNAILKEQTALTTYEEFLKWQSCAGHTYVDGICSNCGYGPCKVNGHILADSSKLNSKCTICNQTCTHDYENIVVTKEAEDVWSECEATATCSNCNFEGTTTRHNFTQSGTCTICGYVCPRDYIYAYGDSYDESTHIAEFALECEYHGVDTGEDLTVEICSNCWGMWYSGWGDYPNPNLGDNVCDYCGTVISVVPDAEVPDVPEGIFTFTIGGIEFQAEGEMKWGQWCNSSYNTIDAYYDESSDTIRSDTWAGSGCVIGYYGDIGPDGEYIMEYSTATDAIYLRTQYEAWT